MESSDDDSHESIPKMRDVKSQEITRTRPVRNRRAPVIYGKSKENEPRKRSRGKNTSEIAAKKSNMVAKDAAIHIKHPSNIPPSVETLSTTNFVMANTNVKKELMFEFTVNDTARVSVASIVKLPKNIIKIGRKKKSVKPIEDNIHHVHLLDDSTTDTDNNKENNEHDDVPSKTEITHLENIDANVESVNPLKLLLNVMPNQQSTPTPPRNNIQFATKSNNLRTPPASILRKPDSPCLIGRRVHFEVESSTNSASNNNTNSFRCRFKSGFVSPSRIQSLQRKSDSGLLKLPLELYSSACNEKAEKKSIQLKAGVHCDDDNESTNIPEVASCQDHSSVFMPDYVHIKDAIRLKICQMLAPSTGSKILSNQLKSRGIVTVGQLASLSEAEMAQLYIRNQPTKVAKARAVISSLYMSLITPKPIPPIDISVLASPSVALAAKSGSNTLLLTSENKDVDSSTAESLTTLESSTVEPNIDGLVSMVQKSADVSLVNKAESRSADALLANEAVFNSDTIPIDAEATVLKATECIMKSPVVNVQIMEVPEDEDGEPMLDEKEFSTVKDDLNDYALSHGDAMVDFPPQNECLQTEESVIRDTTDADAINAKIVEFSNFIANIEYSAWTPVVDNSVLHLVSELVARMDAHRKRAAVTGCGK